MFVFDFEKRSHVLSVDVWDFFPHSTLCRYDSSMLYVAAVDLHCCTVFHHVSVTKSFPALLPIAFFFFSFLRRLQNAALVIHISWGTRAGVSLGWIPRYRIVDCVGCVNIQLIEIAKLFSKIVLTYRRQGNKQTQIIKYKQAYVHVCVLNCFPLA